jgi:hypothetical protein
MPQPGVHLMLADATLQHWRANLMAPFDMREQVSRDAFLLGALGPDMGLYPGGDTAFSQLAHRRRTTELLFALLSRAQTSRQRAFCWGWLTHILADVGVHPLVNEAATLHARASGCSEIVEHVRTEVGLDVWFAQHFTVTMPARPPFVASEMAFIADAYRAVHAYHVSTQQLHLMQHGALHFTRLALHFARAVAPQMCWNEIDQREPVPAAAALLWRVASSFGGADSVVRAYLNPRIPEAWLLYGVTSVTRTFAADACAVIARGLHTLPEYDLEDGTVIGLDRAA